MTRNSLMVSTHFCSSASITSREDAEMASNNGECDEGRGASCRPPIAGRRRPSSHEMIAKPRYK